MEGRATISRSLRRVAPPRPYRRATRGAAVPFLRNDTLHSPSTPRAARARAPRLIPGSAASQRPSLAISHAPQKGKGSTPGRAPPQLPRLDQFRRGRGGLPRDLAGAPAPRLRGGREGVRLRPGLGDSRRPLPAGGGRCGAGGGRGRAELAAVEAGDEHLEDVLQHPILRPPQNYFSAGSRHRYAAVHPGLDALHPRYIVHDVGPCKTNRRSAHHPFKISPADARRNSPIAGLQSGAMRPAPRMSRPRCPRGRRMPTRAFHGRQDGDRGSASSSMRVCFWRGLRPGTGPGPRETAAETGPIPWACPGRRGSPC